MFDKDKPYGEVHGKSTNYRYIQGGKFYATDGTEVNEDGTEVKVRVKRATKPKENAS